MNGDLLGFKFSAWEGGHRVPFIARWPEKIRAGQTNDELMTTMDLLPTFAKLAGAEIPTDRVIDGKDIWPVLAGDAKTPHEAFYYHRRDDLAAVRSGDWKLHTRMESHCRSSIWIPTSLKQRMSSGRIRQLPSD
jgi:arylsulfatase A